jgi:type IV secretory pathway component VirB8
MARPVEASVFKVDRVMIKAELRNWVEKLYTINADELVRENLRYVETRSKSEAVGQLANWRREEKVFERLLTAPQLKRDAKVTSIDVDRNDGVAFLTLLTVETGSPDTAPKRLRFTVNYVTEPSDREEVLTRNPLGFYVTHFSAAKELQ